MRYTIFAVRIIGQALRGLQRLHEEGIVHRDLTPANLMLTPAPEQGRDAHSADGRADIYSLGCVLYHCLTGRPPFPGGNAIQKVVRHATERPRPLRELNPSAPQTPSPVIPAALVAPSAPAAPDSAPSVGDFIRSHLLVIGVVLGGIVAVAIIVWLIMRTLLP